MRIDNLPTGDRLKATGVGIVAAILLSAMMVPAVRLGISPLPELLGLAVSPKLIVASLVPHVLFAVFLRGLCRLAFKPQRTTASQSPASRERYRRRRWPVESSATHSR